MLVVIAVVTVVVSLLLMARLIMIVPVSPSSRFGLDASGRLPFLGTSPAFRLPVRIGKSIHFSLSIDEPFTIPALEVV